MVLRLRTVVLVLLAAAALGVVALTLASRSPTGPVGVERSGSEATAVPGRDGALAVLHAWDRERGAAWARGDPVALGRLYVPGSVAGRADLALLRRYTSRGLVVRGMRVQVLEARVLVARPRTLVLEVTDRLAGAAAARAANPKTTRSLPSAGASRHVLRFRRVGTHWLIAAVTAPSPAAP